jgi:hypothetical protein
MLHELIHTHPLGYFSDDHICSRRDFLKPQSAEHSSHKPDSLSFGSIGDFFSRGYDIIHWTFNFSF